MSLLEMTLKDVFAKIRRILGSAGFRTETSVSVESGSELRKILEPKPKPKPKPEPEPKADVVVPEPSVFSENFGINDEALEGMVMDELAVIRLRAAQIQVRRGFKNVFFDITPVRTTFEVLGIDVDKPPVNQYMEILRGFHCVKFDDMTPEIKGNLEFLISKIVDKGFREIYSKNPDNT